MNFYPRLGYYGELGTWRRSPLPSIEAGNSSLYRQLRLRAYSGRSAPAGVTAIAPIGLRTSTRGPRGTGYPVLKGRGSKFPGSWHDE